MTKTATKPKKRTYHGPKEYVAYNKIKSILEQTGMSQQEFADLCFGGDKSFAARIVNNQRPQISLPIAFRISKVLKTPIEKIFVIKPINS
jgi:DNA-binding XRE family transcriptional regulator